jgi:leucyl-tRNA---protein transferase
MIDNEKIIINEQIVFTGTQMPSEEFDVMMKEGWRMLGTSFIRHNVTYWDEQMCGTIPLRIDLSKFQISKSQRKVLRKNIDLTIKFAIPQLTPEKHELFLKHTNRFSQNKPETLFSFLSDYSHVLPVPGAEFMIFDADQLIACSYSHVGGVCLNSTYCFFDPAYQSRSLGLLTMLVEIIYALKMDKKYYYLGYCYDIPSQFDYKKGFYGLESMNWETFEWSSKPRSTQSD